MPYIEKKRRIELKGEGEGVHGFGINADGPGELNFLVTMLVLGYLGGTVSYRKINDVIGALECAKQEIYRRLAVPYEMMKIAQNGDVF